MILHKALCCVCPRRTEETKRGEGKTGLRNHLDNIRLLQIIDIKSAHLVHKNKIDVGTILT